MSDNISSFITQPQFTYAYTRNYQMFTSGSQTARCNDINHLNGGYLSINKKTRLMNIA